LAAKVTEVRSQCLEVDVASQGAQRRGALNLKEALELHFEAPLAVETTPPFALSRWNLGRLRPLPFATIKRRLEAAGFGGWAAGAVTSSSFEAEEMWYGYAIVLKYRKFLSARFAASSAKHI
jgi:hypothetical protein